MIDFQNDQRIVLTLDAGGSSFRFRAIQGATFVTEKIVLPSLADDLTACLENIVNGFSQVLRRCPGRPAAISFAFPGPADYPNGIIGDLPNLPAFRGGVALGDFLRERFDLPVFINNDGNLFAYGEASAGFLPWVNGLLEKAGSPKRFRNLLGVTLGTGFGGGLVLSGQFLAGDNSSGGEIHLLRHKLCPETNAEEGACIRALRKVYAEGGQIPFEEAPDPIKIEQIALGEVAGNRAAAVAAYARLGEIAGDAIANALALIDGLVVIGGGISKGWRLFLPALVAELNSTYTSPAGTTFRRLSSTVFNLEDDAQLQVFLAGKERMLKTPGSGTEVQYDSLARLGVGITRLGTSEAIAMGAYAFALQHLDN
jgi:glucokinase